MKLRGAWFRRAVLLLALGVGCGTKQAEPKGTTRPSGPPSAEGTAGGPQAPAEPGAGGRADGEGDPVPAAAPSPREGRERLALDLRSCLRWGQRRSPGGDVRLDLGAPWGAGATLGGWRTGLGRIAEVDGRPVAVATRSSVSLWLPADRDHVVVRLRMMSVADAQPTLYVGDDPVAYPKVPPGRFEVVEARLEPGALLAAGGELRVRVRGQRTVPGAGRTGLLLDWVELRRAEGGAPGEAMAVAGPTEDGFTVPVGAALRCPFVHPGGRLRLRAALQGEGEVTVLGVDARGRTAVLGDGAEGSLDVAVPGEKGDLVAVELAARQGPVTLREPRLVTLHERLEAPAELRPVRNVLVFLVDTLRADALRVYRPASRVETPALAALAAESVVFEQGHTPENWTKPSVASLLSGLHPWLHRATDGDSVVPASVRLLPELLRRKGYATAGFVANGYVSGKFGFRRGWDRWRNYIREGRRTKAQFVADDVLRWLERRPQGKPFFLYVHTIDPHVPYIPPDRILRRYDPAPYQGPVSFVRDRLLLEHVKLGKVRLGERDKARLRALYDAEITYHDEHFGRILEGLRQAGLLEETAIFVVADHGEEFFEHGSVGHGHSVYEELLHVPFIVRWPGVPPRRVRAPVSLADVVPTVLEALGVEAPEEVSGRSLLPLLRGEPEGRPHVSVSGFQDGWRVVQLAEHKLAVRSGRDFRYFDLRSDPDEQEAMGLSERPLAVTWLRALLGAELYRHLGWDRRGAPEVSAGSEGRPRSAGRPRRGRPAPAVHEAERTDIDPQTEAQLRALGYVGGP